MNMKTKLFLMLLLSTAACRQPGIAAVAPSLEADFAAIVAGYNEAAGYEAFPLDPDGAWVLVDDDEIERNRKEFPTSVGFFDSFSDSVVLPSKTKFLEMGYDEEFYREVLAHEIGHAIITSDHFGEGLMQARAGFVCTGREGACLFEAMQDFKGAAR
jgi:hypothetical protein